MDFTAEWLGQVGAQTDKLTQITSIRLLFLVFPRLFTHTFCCFCFCHFSQLWSPDMSNPATAPLLQLRGGADMGDPGYKAISGSSWQLQEITATFLAHCPTAVKQHMLHYCWASSKKCTCLEEILSEAENQRPETRAVALAKVEPWHHNTAQCNGGGKRHGDGRRKVLCTVCTWTMNAHTQICRVPNAVSLQLSMPLVRTWTHWREDNRTLWDRSPLIELNTTWGSVLPLPCLRRRKHRTGSANHMAEWFWLDP